MFVANGVFFAELNEMLARELAEDGYNGLVMESYVFVMESGPKGCKVIVSGKFRAQHAKSMKFKDGYMISSCHPVKKYIDSAVRHVPLRQGVLGIKVKVMLDWEKESGDLLLHCQPC